MNKKSKIATAEIDKINVQIDKINDAEILVKNG